MSVNLIRYSPYGGMLTEGIPEVSITFILNSGDKLYCLADVGLLVDKQRSLTFCI